MGIVSSNSKSRLGICLTLDAFGTLYHPKRPIAVQYLEVAQQCGLKADIQVPELEASFRKQFKDQSARYPNYGKSKDMSVETWWDSVVYGAFHPLCRGHHIPDSLGPTLFRHFSSRNAYALYPDVVPFFQSMRELREKYSDPKGPIIIVGIITNSDSRARSILESLSLQVGNEWEPSFRDIPASGKALQWYNSSDDINFLVTSYATGYEKPRFQIFREADDLASNLPLSRLEQSSPDEFLSGNPFKTVKGLAEGYGLTSIHVGDDFEKDYQGAKDADRQALHLCRDQKDELKDYQISNLLELATFIKLMANANFDNK